VQAAAEQPLLQPAALPHMHRQEDTLVNSDCNKKEQTLRDN